MAKMLDYALQYADKNISIFPCNWPTSTSSCSCKLGEKCKNPGKHPYIKGWQEAASCDRDQIIQWWTDWPAANIGVPTGALNGVDVLDDDPKHGGDVTLASICSEFGPLPDTPRVLTGSLGHHHWFSHCPGLRNNNHGQLGIGLDWRTDGGLVIAPPSRHVSGNRYRWEHECSTAPVPAWIVERLGKENDHNKWTARRKPDGYWRDLALNVDIGDRHNAVMSIAGLLFNLRGLDPTLALTLVYGYNLERCDPPKTRDEISSIINYVLTKKLGK